MRTNRLLRPAALGVLVALPLTAMGQLPATGAKTYSKARVLKVLDGDTVRVDQNFDGRPDADVRLIGVDTPERGRCGAAAATRGLSSLVRKKSVVLRSDTGRTGIRNRPERRVLVRSQGSTVDATTWMLERGLGVWMPRQGETTNSRAHHQAADRAAAAGLGWFDPNRCGVGPQLAGTLRMRVQWQADATKRLSATERRNQEFVRITNDGAAPLDLDGWVLRVGNDRSRKIPEAGPVPAGESVFIHVGSGTNTVNHRYLGSSVPMLLGADPTGKQHLGSGSYLLDPHGDIAASMTWPCTIGCTDAALSGLRVAQVMYDPPGSEAYALNSEYVAVTNAGDVPVRTGDTVVEIWPWVFEFPADHVLAPGETVRIHGGAGQDEHLHRYLDAVNPPLRNLAGQVVLRSYDAIVLDCVAWGSGRCPSYR